MRLLQTLIVLLSNFSFIFGHIVGFTVFRANIIPIICHRSSSVGHVGECDSIISQVSGSITSCQKVMLIICSAANIHVNSVQNSVIFFHAKAA
jgi:hypothetical protein